MEALGAQLFVVHLSLLQGAAPDRCRARCVDLHGEAQRTLRVHLGQDLHEARYDVLKRIDVVILHNHLPVRVMLALNDGGRGLGGGGGGHGWGMARPLL